MRSNQYAVDCLLVARRQTRRGGVPELLTFQDEDGCVKRPSDAPFGMVTGGAKSSESPYLSEMYLINSMNRT